MDLDKIQSWYEYFLQKAMSFPYQHVFTQRDDKILLKFIQQMTDEHKIFDYLCFQCQYWQYKKTRIDNGFLPTSWLFGKKAIVRWNDRNVDFAAVLISQWKAQVDASLSDVVENTFYEPEFTSHDIYRRACDNEPTMRLRYCTSLDISYSWTSMYCSSCVDRKLCQQLISAKNVRTNA